MSLADRLFRRRGTARSGKPAPAPPQARAPVPVALPIAVPVAEVLTNIDTTDLANPANGFVGNLPVAQLLPDTGPIPDPLWISRWQPSATVPIEKAPWVVGYRWWVPGNEYQSLGVIDYYRIDLKFKDGHKHAYLVREEVWEDFRQLTTSVGQWLHQVILGKGWTNKNGQLVGAYQSFEIV